MKGSMYKVVVVNTSFLSTEIVNLRNTIKTFVENMVSNDEAKTCALIFAPTVGEYKHAYDDHSIEKVSRDLLDDLRDSAVINVKAVNIMFEPETMWSENRSYYHQAFMCIAKKVEKVDQGSGLQMFSPISDFFTSKLWVRARCPSSSRCSHARP